MKARPIRAFSYDSDEEVGGSDMKKGILSAAPLCVCVCVRGCVQCWADSGPEQETRSIAWHPAFAYAQPHRPHHQRWIRRNGELQAQTDAEASCVSCLMRTDLYAITVPGRPVIVDSSCFFSIVVIVVVVKTEPVSGRVRSVSFNGGTVKAIRSLCVHTAVHGDPLSLRFPVYLLPRDGGSGGSSGNYTRDEQVIVVSHHK